MKHCKRIFKLQSSASRPLRNTQKRNLKSKLNHYNNDSYNIHITNRANAEISRVQQANEKEISLLKAKLQKSDLKLKTIEGALEQKQNENKELMAICDDLIKKMENNNSA